MRFLRLAAWVILCGLFTSSSAFAAGRVFFDGFEDGTTNAWAADDYRNKCIATTTAADAAYGAHTGSYMARCNWDGTVAWNDPAAYTSLVLGSWSYTSDFFIRFWVRTDANVDTQFGSKWLRLYSAGAVNSFIFDGQLEQANGPVFTNLEVIDGTSTNLTDYGGGTIATGTWRKVEIYFHVCSPSCSTLKTWINGTLDRNTTGFSASTSNKWYPLYILSNWSNNGPEWEHDATNYTYWDDIEIYSDTGSGATGNMSDATITQGGGSPPVMSSVTCTPTIIQSPGTTSCTASATNSPTSYTWSVSSCTNAQCSTSSTSSAATLTCQYGGACTPCASATNADGTSSVLCAAANYLAVRLRKGSGLTVH